MTTDQTYWRATSTAPSFSGPLPSEVDVVVIGGGITGVNAAFLLKQAGRSVALFERERIGAGETGNTSAHVTCITDERLSQLDSQFGRDAARLAWSGGAAAIDLIESNVEELGIACGFRRVPGFLCGPFLDEDAAAHERDRLAKEAELAAQLGFVARFVERGPIAGRPALAMADQAVFHPLEYTRTLARAVDGAGSYVRDMCEVGEVMQDPLAVIVDGQTIACRDIVIATHVPMVGIRNLVAATLFQTKLYPYQTYVLGARVDDAGIAPGLYFDTADPYYYLRVHEDDRGLYGIFGGVDHKTGQEPNTESRIARLEAAFVGIVPSGKIERRWTGQVIETDDGLPFIGEVAEHQYVATGYAGNGLTFGTLAGLMIHDAITGRQNPWRELFSPTRKATSKSSIATLVSENADYPFYYVIDRLRPAPKSGVESVLPGEGKVLSIDGRRVAVHRAESGEVVAVDAICTHMGCIVRWNKADRTWDCPCHGSRFTPEGLVLGGPAESPLERVDV